MLSETCEFYGRSGHVDTALSDGLLSGGAKAVAGFVNNVYSVYSRSMLWADREPHDRGRDLAAGH